MNKYLFKLFSFKKKMQLTLLNKYTELENQFMISLLNSLNKMARNAIIAEGKNPDYVAPPPPPKVQDIVKPTKSFNFVSAPCPWVKDPSSHPVLKSRAAFAVKSTTPIIEDFEKALDMKFVETDTEDMKFVETTTDIDPIEITSGTRPVTRKSVAVKKKAPKKVVKKSKSGSFRRV